jgi:hypothetical protein
MSRQITLLPTLSAEVEGRRAFVRSFRTASFAVALAVFAGSMGAVSGADLSRVEVTATLHAIKQTADEIAAGRFATKKQLREQARIIAIDWAKAEPVLISRGFAIVETRFANRSIVVFERDWKQPSKARVAAHEVSANIDDLLSTRRQYGKSSIAPPPSATP